MKHYFISPMLALPMFCALSVAPHWQNSSHQVGRSIASTKTEAEKDNLHPKYDKKASSIKAVQLPETTTAEDFEKRSKEFKENFKKISSLITKEESDKNKVKEQSSQLDDLIIKLHLLDKYQAKLTEQKDEDKKAIDGFKIEAEKLLVILDENEKLVAKKEEDSCKNESHKGLSAKIDELFEQQKLITQSLLGMNQVLLRLIEQQQNNYPYSYYSNGVGNLPNPYTYTPSFSSFYPDRFQQNPAPTYIFNGGSGNNYYGQQPSPGVLSPYGQGPSLGQENPYSPLPVPTFTPGNFGGNQMSFNLQNTVPTLTLR